MVKFCKNGQWELNKGPKVTMSTQMKTHMNEAAHKDFKTKPVLAPKKIVLPDTKEQNDRASMYSEFTPKGSFSKNEVSFSKNGQWKLKTKE